MFSEAVNTIYRKLYALSHMAEFIAKPIAVGTC
jgi:hypothetical protein